MNKACAGIVLLAVMGIGTTEAQATPITFSTSGVFSNNSNVISFANGSGTTTLLFNGAPSALVDTPAGASFGSLSVTSTVPSLTAGPAVNTNFTLDFTSSEGTGSLLSTLSGTLGFNSGVATLMFTSTSVTINGYTFTVNPLFTIALPGTGSGGGVPAGMTTLQGTIVGGAAVPENGGTLVLLGVALLGLVLVQRHLRFA